MSRCTELLERFKHLNEEASPAQVEKAIKEVETLNNIRVRKQIGQSMVVYYITGTKYALQGVDGSGGAEGIFKEAGIPYSYGKQVLKDTLMVSYTK